MSLAPGTRLGPYEIVAALGAGGMGEVYRARDARLARTVAVKILPETVVGDSQRLRWFEREAKAVAALNHPNILSVHDVGEQDGVHFIVTELLEGATLRHELERGALPPRRATEYAAQIARGLAAAHEKGIVHRDVKPENLFVTKDGHVKILDFGLARQAPAALQPADAIVTVAATQTVAGTVMGTIGYMAPEQVTGAPVDHRADIFAFGVVCYEMLTGKRAFQRDSAIATSAAILQDDPPEMLASGRQPISPGLQHLVQHCLQKDPAHRFQSARDVALALDSVSAASTQSLPQVSTASRRNLWRWSALTVALLFVAIAVTAALVAFRRPQQPDFRQITLEEGFLETARFAPDGHTIVYSARWDQTADEPLRLYTVRDDATQVRRLDLPPSALYAVSKTGDLAIGQFSTGRMSRVPLAGGAPLELTTNVVDGDWLPDSASLAVARFDGGNGRLEFPRGKVVYQSVARITDVRVSPRGDAVAFMEHPIPADDRGSVAIVDATGSKRTLTREWNGEDGIAWSPNGEEVWFTATDRGDTDRGLYAVTRSGRERLVLRAPGGLRLQDIAPDGRVLLKRDDRRWEVVGGRVGEPPRKLSWLQMMEVAPGAVSADGRFVVMSEISGTTPDYEVYLVKFDGSPPVLLGSGRAGGISPDAKWVTSLPPADNTKVLILPTGIGETRTVTAPGFHYQETDWTSDGRRLVVCASESGRPNRMWVQEPAGGAPRAITPEGLVGRLVTVNHADFVAGRTPGEMWRLYPVDGGMPRSLDVLSENDAVVGGSPAVDIVYVASPGPHTLSKKIEKVNLSTGVRQPFLTLEPTERAGAIALLRPIFSQDGTSYVANQIRTLSVLYLATGLK
jgi:hypothetical protein